MRVNKQIWVAGFAIFSMFFGAGNLTFPLLVGIETESQFFSGMLGFVLSGVLVPFVGLLSMMLFRCKRDHFFASLGDRMTWVISLIILVLMGPLGGAPRCANVAYGSFQAIFPSLSPVVFNAIFCMIATWMILNREKVIPWIGGILSPVLLISVAILIVAGLIRAKTSLSIKEICNVDSFVLGLKKGYQTMDLLASFFFSTTAFIYLYAQHRLSESKRKSHACKEKKENCVVCDSHIINSGIKSSVIGVIALTVIYVGFILLGALYSEQLKGLEGHKCISAIADKTLGKFSLPLVALIFSLACLTTTVAVLHLFADFFQEEICSKKISNTLSLFLTITLTYFVSLLGFDKICYFLGYIIEVVYPALIAFTLCKLLDKFFNFNKSALVFYIVLLISIICRLT